MQFTQGQTVIHPQHGPAKVVGTTSRTIRGAQVTYVALEISGTGMTVQLPQDRAREIGVRRVADAELLAELAGVLCGPSEPQEEQWTRRIKAQYSEVTSGDPVRVAAVVRDLVRRQDERGLSHAEKELLRDASAPLVAEIALAVDTPEDDARRVLLALALDASVGALTAREPASA